MMKYTVPIGQREETFQAENVLAVVQPPMTKGTSDIPGEIRRAIRNPIGCEDLQKIAAGKSSAAIVVNDITRPYPGKEMVLVLAEELNAAGIPDGEIRLIMAYGHHRDNTREELRKMFGQEILNRSFSSAFKGSPYSSDHIITIDCDRLGDVVAEQAVAEATEFSKYNLDYSGITLRNVKIVGQPAGTRTTAKVLTKYPCHKIRNVTFEKVPEMEIQSGGALENFKVNGRRVK